MTPSKKEDVFDRAADTEPPPLKSRYVSTGSVDVGEGIQFEVLSLELVTPRWQDAEPDLKVYELTGTVIESRAAGIVDEGEITITCGALRLEQMAKEIEVDAGPGALVTLIRGEDEGKTAGWRWLIDAQPPTDAAPIVVITNAGDDDTPFPTEEPEEEA